MRHFITSDKRLLPPGGAASPFSVEIPDTEDVRANGIPVEAFFDCTGLTSVVIWAGITEIGNNAFYGCSGLTSIVLPEGITHIGIGAFYGCSGITSIVLPEGITRIGAHAFGGCSRLTSIVLPESVNHIGGNAFNECSGLTSVIVPKGVSRIGRETFSGCTGLVVVRLLSRDPIEVSPDAFADCNRLSLVVAPLSSGVVGKTFVSCPLLQGAGIVEDTAANLRRAFDLQYWRVGTHQLCSAPHRRWVQTVLLVANRLRGGALALPDEMWHSILESIRRGELGRAP
jgi:hypothetical protein